MPSFKPINLAQRQSLITELWSPQHLFNVNSSISFKMAKIDGTFVWHSHPDTDEVFYCISGGPFVIEMATDPVSKHERDGYEAVELKVGDMLCIPQGLRHRPVAEQGETGILLIEKLGTVNTGDEQGKADGGFTKQVNETNRVNGQ